MKAPGSANSEHVTIKQLTDDFARYLYLPRLKTTDVLYRAIADGVKLLTWMQDSFAFADSYDEAADRYAGLQTGQLIDVASHDDAVRVAEGWPSARFGSIEVRPIEDGLNTERRYGSGRS